MTEFNIRLSIVTDAKLMSAYIFKSHMITLKVVS
jgi:hypothetical protein